MSPNGGSCCQDQKSSMSNLGHDQTKSNLTEKTHNGTVDLITKIRTAL